MLFGFAESKNQALAQTTGPVVPAVLDESCQQASRHHRLGDGGPPLPRGRNRTNHHRRRGRADNRGRVDLGTIAIEFHDTCKLVAHPSGGELYRTQSKPK